MTDLCDLLSDAGDWAGTADSDDHDVACDCATCLNGDVATAGGCATCYDCGNCELP